MTHITLVLPFALPPPELAPDLLRELKAPALAALLTRAQVRTQACDAAERALPHERYLASALGLGDGFARAAMAGFGLDAGDGCWFIVNPAHIEIARNNLLMTDLRSLQLADADSRALFDLATPYFADVGKPLLYGDPATWFMRADDWADLQTASPDAAAGMNLTDWLPKGERAIAYRKLQNEVQMLWFEHPVNNGRESRRLATVNSFWPWGSSAKASARPATPFVTVGAPGWLRAISNAPEAVLPAALDEAIDGTVLYCGSLAGHAIAADWSSWLMQMMQLDETLFAPALAAVKQGRIARLTLMLDHRTASVEADTTPMAQRAFWRRPTLNRLLP